MTLSLRPIFLALSAAALVTSARAQTPPVTPAEATSFDEVTAKLDRGGSFYLYLSTAKWLDGLSTTVAGYRDLIFPTGAKKPADPNAVKGFDLTVDLIKGSGIEGITGVGASSVAIQPGIYRNTVFVHHNKGKNMGLLATLFGAAPHALNGLDLLPVDTAAASYCDFDLATLITGLRTEIDASNIPEVTKSLDEGLAQFQTMTGMTLEVALQSLGGAGGFILTLDADKPVEIQFGAKAQTLPNPRLALVFETRNDRIFQRLEQVGGGMPGLIKVDEPGLRMRTMAVPASPKWTARVTVAQTDKLLIIASDDRLVREILTAQTSGMGFKATPEFAAISSGLPTAGNGFSLGTQAFIDAWKKIQRDIINNQPKGDASQEALMQKLMEAQTAGPVYGVSSHVDNGWLTVSKGAQSLNQAMLPLMIVPAAIGAGVMMPILNKAHEKAEAKAPEPEPTPAPKSDAKPLKPLKKAPPRRG